MSGSCDSRDCPRCTGANTLLVSTDWKPFDLISAECSRCGLFYYLKFEQADKEYLKDMREGNEDDDIKKEVLRPFTKEEINKMKEFDKEYGVKTK